MSLPDIKRVVRENKIRGVSHLNKKELISKLQEHDIVLPDKRPRQKKVVDEAKVIDPKYDRLKTIRNNPRKVSTKDVETGDTVEHKSMYAAARSLNKTSKHITDYNGKIYKNKYEINIL